MNKDNSKYVITLVKNTTPGEDRINRIIFFVHPINP